MLQALSRTSMSRTSLVLNGALAAAVVLITRRLYKVEAELDRVSALAEAANRHAEAARTNSPLPAGHTAMSGDRTAGMTELAAEWEQAILPTDS